jgi:UDP-glucose-4-epimerase GalE
VKKVMVIGGAGYIGSHTCKYLASEGIEPVVFDNLSEGHRDFVRWGDLIEGDIRDRAAVEAALVQAKPDGIIHFAANIEVGESTRDPGAFYENNVGGALNVAIAARDAGNLPIVFSSTCAIYGRSDADRVAEDTVQAPMSPYGRTKLMVEQILNDFGTAYGVPWVCLRYFNACGADLDGQIGEAHSVETHLVPRAILAGLGKLDGFAVFGDDYDTPDGSAVRDYIHVLDLAQAHVRALRYLWQGGESTQFNIGTGKGTSVFEIIGAVERALGVKVPYTLGPRRAGDPPCLVADATRAETILGFKAEHSDIETVIQSAAAWHKQLLQIRD